MSCNYNYRFHKHFLKKKIHCLNQFFLFFNSRLTLNALLYLKQARHTKYFSPSGDKIRLPYSFPLRFYLRVLSLSLDPYNAKRQTIARLSRLLLMHGTCRFKPLREQHATREKGEEKRVAFGGREAHSSLCLHFLRHPLTNGNKSRCWSVVSFRLFDFIHARSRSSKYASRIYGVTLPLHLKHPLVDPECTLRTILRAASAGSKRHGRDEKSRASRSIQTRGNIYDAIVLRPVMHRTLHLIQNSLGVLPNPPV